jgi:hypothetical protein
MNEGAGFADAPRPVCIAAGQFVAGPTEAR